MHSPGRSNHAITYLKFFEDQIGASFSFSTNRVSFIVMKNNAYTTNIKETWRWKISVVCQTVKMSAPLLQSLCWLEPSYDVYISLLHVTHLRYRHIFKHSLLVPDFLFSWCHQIISAKPNVSFTVTSNKGYRLSRSFLLFTAYVEWYALSRFVFIYELIKPR